MIPVLGPTHLNPTGKKADDLRVWSFCGDVGKSINRYDWDLQLCTSWYLVRTKPSKERYVSAQLAQLAPEVFLPLLSMAERHTDPCDNIVPLFPQYVFLRCDLTAHYFRIRYVPGVSSFVTVGRDPLPVPQSIVESVRARCTNDVVHLQQAPFDRASQFG